LPLTYLPNREDMLDRSVLPDFVDIDGRINRIRFSIDILKMDELYHKSLTDILQDSNNILSRAEKFKVYNIIINLSHRQTYK
jgi:hypothetical protein